MSTKQYNSLINSVKACIYEKTSFTPIHKKVIEFVISSQHVLFIDMICTQLSAAFLNKSSEIVNKATIIFSELALLGGQELTLRMSQKQFQENLCYTLRGRTSTFGNKFTLHASVWNQIETRVLKIYQFWFERFMTQQDKFHNILEKYRYLKSIKVEFPASNPITPIIPKMPIKTILQEILEFKTKDQIQQDDKEEDKQDMQPSKIEVPDQKRKQENVKQSPIDIIEQIRNIEEFTIQCQTSLNQKKLSNLLNNQAVRSIKTKSARLYTIFKEDSIYTAGVIQKVKNLYSRLRALLKFIDKQNQKIKLQQEKNFVQSKITLLKSKNSDIKTESPQKEKEKEKQFSNIKIKNKSSQNQQTDLLQMEPITIVQLSSQKKIEPKSEQKSQDQFEMFQTSDQIQQKPEQEIISISQERKQHLIDTSPTKQPLLSIFDFNMEEMPNKPDQPIANQNPQKIQAEKQKQADLMTIPEGLLL